MSVSTGSDGLGPSSWEHWWRFNKDAYLELKVRIASNVVATAGGDPSSPVDRRARALASLEAALAKERQPDIVSSALVGLARTCDGDLRADAAELSARLSPFLADANQEIAETSAAALGILGCESSIPLLVDLLRDTPAGQRATGKPRVPERTRAFAAFGLALAARRSEHEDPRRFALHNLIAQLSEPMGAMPDVHAACVIGIGLVPIGTVVDDGGEAAPTGNPREAGVRTLEGVLADRKRHAFVRAHAGDALARLASDAGGHALRTRAARAILDVAAMERDEPAEVVRGAVAALGRLGTAGSDPLDVEIRAALRRRIEGLDRQARLFALIALAHVGARGGGEGAESAVKAVKDALTDRLVRGPQYERCWAALALGVLERERVDAHGAPDAELRAALRRALDDAGSPTEVAALSIACGLARAREAGTIALAKLARVNDPAARGYVAIGLGMLEERAAIEPLHAVLESARFQPTLLRDAAIALALIGDDKVVPTLIESLQSATSLSSQSAAAIAVGFSSDDRAIEPLVWMIDARSSSTAGSRAFAAAALGLVCDQERIPWNAQISAGFNYFAALPTQSDGLAGILDIL